MNVSRGFLTISVLYLLVGIGLGMHMGSSGDQTFLPVHAHISLLGFTLMAVFGLTYHVFPAMAESVLGRAHFWLHQAGTLGTVAMIWLLFSGAISDAGMFPVAPISEALVFLGVAAFAVNVFRAAK